MVTLCVHHTVFLERERVAAGLRNSPFRRVAFLKFRHTRRQAIRSFVHSFIRVIRAYHLHTRHSLTAGRHEQPPSFSHKLCSVQSRAVGRTRWRPRRRKPVRGDTRGGVPSRSTLRKGGSEPTQLTSIASTSPPLPLPLTHPTSLPRTSYSTTQRRCPAGADGPHHLGQQACADVADVQ
jgi:hypothetical protein